MTDPHERLRRLHALLGSPKEVHTRLYEKFPRALGYSSKQTDSTQFEAVLMLALLQASDENGGGFHKVYFLTPASLADGWVLTEFRASAKRIFDRLKAGKSVAAVKRVGELFHQVMLGSQVFMLPQEPDRWVAFGFSKSDPIPEWMRQKLLELDGIERDLSAGV